MVAIASLWPTTNTLDDGYQLFASNPFEDAQHPAGYGLIVAGLGHLTQSVVLPVLLQHVAGIVSALVFFAATRRISGSAWAGLFPAGIVLLNPDMIFLEQAIMSETWAVLASAVGLYAAVRATEPERADWRWGLLAGGALGLGVMIRTAGLLMIPVVVLAVLLCRPRPLRDWRRSLPAPLAMAAAAAIVLFAYASANAAFGPRFGVGPSPGWYLYGRAAQFADCSEFSPPAGTEILCDNRPPSERPGAHDLLFSPEEAAQRYFGPFGNHDDLLGEWASRAARAQPLDFARTAWDYLRAYYVPATLRQGLGGGLSPQVDFTFDNVFYAEIVEGNLEAFYGPFTAHRFQPGLDFLGAWQQLARFGAAALSVTTALVLVGLLIGSRRSRVGVAIFGLGGLALIVAPALTGSYAGRYTVPMAAPLMAAAGIALVELRQAWAGRRAGDAPG